MSKTQFFRQSGWMMLTGGLSGAVFYLVHPVLNVPLAGFLEAPLEPKEWGLFSTLIVMFTILMIPAPALQLVFAQQAAAAVTHDEQARLRRVIRIALACMFGLWLVMVAVVGVGETRILTALDCSEPMALWLVLAGVLPALCMSVLMGVMQGQQNFLWLGLTSLVNALGRLLLVAILVRILGAKASGAIAGVVVGTFASLALCVWQTWRMLWGPSERVDWADWARRVVPLTLGLGSAVFVQQADISFVAARSSDSSAWYNAVGVTGRALVFATAPMVAVMFPKVVRGATRPGDANLPLTVLGLTATLAAFLALLCTVLPSLPLRLLTFNPNHAAVPLVPWYAWCVVPMTLANVLIYNLMAREQFGVVPWLVAISILYWVALQLSTPDAATFKTLSPTETVDALRTVVQILGVFGSLLAVVAGVYTWRRSKA